MDNFDNITPEMIAAAAAATISIDPAALAALMAGDSTEIVETSATAVASVSLATSYGLVAATLKAELEADERFTVGFEAIEEVLPLLEQMEPWDSLALGLAALCASAAAAPGCAAGRTIRRGRRSTTRSARRRRAA